VEYTPAGALVISIVCNYTIYKLYRRQVKITEKARKDRDAHFKFAMELLNRGPHNEK